MIFDHRKSIVGNIDKKREFKIKLPSDGVVKVFKFSNYTL